MLFCPTCSNLLLTEKTTVGEIRFFCKTCPYVFKIENMKIENKMPLERKEKDDVFYEKEKWSNADKTVINCVSSTCRNEKAYFYSIQIRGADEPMTTFYKCTECGEQWNENA